MAIEISVIVPVYNSAATLRRTVDSVLAQEGCSWELLLVDDGSTDMSAPMCDAYALRDERCRAIHRPNGGVSRARNAGLEAARGEWIFFLDADDWIEPGTLTRLLSLARGHDAPLAMCGVQLPDRLSPPLSEEIVRVVDGETVRESLFREIFFSHYNGFLWNKLYRRDVIEGAGIRFAEELRYNEDRLFVYDYLTRGGVARAVYTTAQLYHYVPIPSGAMGRVKPAGQRLNPHFEDDLEAFERMRRMADPQAPSTRALYLDYCMAVCRFYDLSRHTDEAGAVYTRLAPRMRMLLREGRRCGVERFRGDYVRFARSRWLYEVLRFYKKHIKS